MNILKIAEEIWDVDDFRSVCSKYKIPAIYAWYNKVNQKIYIGSSINLYKRFANYYLAINSKAKFHTPILKRAFEKYGKGGFLFLILEKVSDANLCVEREQCYLDLFQPFDGLGYNIAHLASSTLGTKRSAEANLKNKARQQGENGSNVKLRNQDVMGIFIDFSNKMSFPDIAAKYAISKRQISLILHRKQWGHLDIPTDVINKVSDLLITQFSPQQVLEIGRLLLSGKSCGCIANKFNVSRGTIELINLGKSFPDLKKKLAPTASHICIPPNFISEELRQNIINDIKMNFSNKEMIAKYGIHRRTVWNYRRLFGNNG